MSKQLRPSLERDPVGEVLLSSSVDWAMASVILLFRETRL